MDSTTLRDFTTAYTAAWCSHDAARVASFYAENGSLQTNDGSGTSSPAAGDATCGQSPPEGGHYTPSNAAADANIEGRVAHPGSG